MAHDLEVLNSITSSMNSYREQGYAFAMKTSGSAMEQVHVSFAFDAQGHAENEFMLGEQFDPAEWFGPTVKGHAGYTSTAKSFTVVKRSREEVKAAFAEAKIARQRRNTATARTMNTEAFLDFKCSEMERESQRRKQKREQKNIARPI